MWEPQRHRDTKGAGAIEDDSGTDNEIKRQNFDVCPPDCSGAFVSLCLCGS
jgi:hypothetical protein